MVSRYEKNEQLRKKVKKNPKKKKFLMKLLLFILTIIVITIIWGMFVEVNILKINEYSIVTNKIPDSFNGVKIVHFSDVHYGTGYNDKRLNKLVDRINSYNPDIVVFTGDLIDNNYNASKEDIELITLCLSKIESKLGKYAIVGNHDFYNDSYENILYNSEFMLLKNNYDTIYNETNNPILIYGIDNITYGDPRVDILDRDSVSNIDYKIVLMHEPDYLDEFVNDYNIDLVLAGHSHNGQVRFPKIKPFFLPEGAKKYYDSNYKVNDTLLYVSSGVGSSIYDFRLFSYPSINVYRLRTN